MQLPTIVDPHEQLGGWFSEPQDVKSSPSTLYAPLDTPISLEIPSSVSSSRRSSISDAPSSSPPESPEESAPPKVSSYYHAPRRSSTSRSRNKDPDKIPRPRNAFIIFRCEYCHKHQEANRGTDRLPTPEKTLSKRAGALWKTMDAPTRQPYIDQAKEEREEHQRKYPNYKYRPNRTPKGSSRKRKSSSMTRREQVELHMRASQGVKRRVYHLRHDSGSASGSESESPSSTFSTPEPRDFVRTPLASEERGLAHRRSMSLPHLPSDPYPFAHTYFIQPTSCISSPGGGIQRITRRAASVSQRSLSDSIPPPDLGFEIDYGPGTTPFVYQPGGHSSTISLPELLSVPENMPLQDTQNESFGSPSVSPLEQPGTQDVTMDGYFHTPTPLYHRRQRSNTAPSTLSPLSVVSSSLQNWNGEASAAAAAASLPVPQPQNELPSFAFTPDTSAIMTPTSSIMSTPMDTPEYTAMAPFLSDSANSLVAPISELDMDRTPRRADFGLNTQGQFVPQYTQASAPMATDFPPLPRSDSDMSLSSYEMESYMAGLDALSITPAPYDMSPFQNVDFDDFIYINQD